MARKLGYMVLSASFFFMLTVLNLAWGQEGNIVSGPPMTNESDTGAQIEWRWGEVLSVDPAANQLKIKYLDYDDDTEKELSLEVNDKTTYENVSSLSQVKPQDNVSIDFVIEGQKNIAKNISLEKMENLQDSKESLGGIETGAPKQDLPQPEEVKSIPGY